MSRRTLLAGLAGAGALGAVGWLAYRAQPRVAEPADDLAGLVDALCGADFDGCLSVAAAALARGVPPDRLLTAVMLMPLWSGGDDSDVHAMAVVPSIRRLVRQTQDTIPVLWAVANAHAWSRPARVELGARTMSRPLVALQRALDEADVERASDAAHAAASEDLSATMQLLCLDATRRRGDVHVVIWAAHAARELSAIPASELTDPTTASAARAIARSVARYACFRGRPQRPPEPFATDAADTTAAVDVARAIQQSAVTPLEGLSAQTVWEALALLCVHTRLSDGSNSGIGVHQSTAFDALWSIWERAPDADRPAVLARAAAWMTDLHHRNATARADPLPLEPSGEDPFALLSESPALAYRAALGALRRDRDAFLAEVQRRLLEHFDDAHDFKHWGAVLDVEARLGSDLRDRWLGALIGSVTARGSGRWARAGEARALLTR